MEEVKKANQEAENLDADETKENEEIETPEQNEEESNDEESNESESDDSGIDYKSELEKAKSIISHKEEVIKAEKEKRKELEKQSQGEVDEEKVTELDEFRKKQEEELSNFKYSVLEDKVEDEVYSLAKSDDEAELMKFHLKNTIKFGYTVKEIKEAVKTAWLKANEKRILATNKELAESLRSKSTSLKSSSSSGKPVGNNKPEYSKSDKEFLRKYGVKV